MCKPIEKGIKTQKRIVNVKDKKIVDSKALFEAAKNLKIQYYNKGIVKQIIKSSGEPSPNIYIDLSDHALLRVEYFMHFSNESHKFNQDCDEMTIIC